MAVEGVRRPGVVQNRPRKDGLRKHAGCIVDQFRERVRGINRQTVREPFFQLCRSCVVGGVPYVVTKQSYGREAREWAQQLLLRYCCTAQGRRRGYLAGKRIGY